MLRQAFEAIFGNFSLKLVALLISAGIWFYAKQQLQDEMLVRAGVKVSAPPGYALLYQSLGDAQVTLSGPRSLISRLRDELAQVPVELTYALSERELQDGWADLEIGQSWLRLGLTERERVQLKVAGIRPAAVRVFVSPRIDKMVDVAVSGNIQTAPGFSYEPAVAMPAQVKVDGPAIAVADMADIPTSEVNLYDIRSDQHRSVGLRTEKRVTLSNGEQVTVQLTAIPASVTVHVRVTGEAAGRRVFDRVPVLWQIPAGFPYRPEYKAGEGVVSVTVTGPEGTLKRLEPDDVRAFVDLARLAREEIEPGATLPAQEPVQVDLPQGFEALQAKANPANVTLVLTVPTQ